MGNSRMASPKFEYYFIYIFPLGSELLFSSIYDRHKYQTIYNRQILLETINESENEYETK